MTPQEFRAVMRCFPTGVAIVTTMVDGAPKGFTANAVASVSAEPPMVLVCVNRSSRSHPLIALAGRFCVNILRLEQRSLAERFASRDVADPFDEVRVRIDATGAPVLEDALAYLDCTVAEEMTAGTHTIFVGSVMTGGHGSGVPLGYFDGGYRDFGCRIL